MEPGTNEPFKPQPRAEDGHAEAARSADGDHRLADAQEPATTERDAGAADLQNALAAAEAKAAEYYDALLRAKAETDNARRRAQEDVAKAHKFGIENFAEALLPVMDSLQGALADASGDVAKIKEGVELTRKQLLSAFERHVVASADAGPGALRDYLFITRGIYNLSYEDAVRLVDRERSRQRSCALAAAGVAPR